MLAIPRVLSAFVAYSNETLGLPDFLATQAQDLIEESTPRYLKALNPKARSAANPWSANMSRTLTPASRLDRSYPLEQSYPLKSVLASVAGHTSPAPWTVLVDTAGGEAALENLTANPLPTRSPLVFGGCARGCA